MVRPFQRTASTWGRKRRPWQVSQVTVTGAMNCMSTSCTPVPSHCGQRPRSMLKEKCPASMPRCLAAGVAVAEAASPQIRNVATVGGNVLQRPRCWYYRLEEYPCLKKGGEVCYAVG
ncbi:MAG: hypothetical protein HC783_08400, partial [Rhodobacteraceae bacterium]|nr:hypothetical protein [Paracoccaceae bacterium]